MSVGRDYISCFSVFSQQERREGKGASRMLPGFSSWAGPFTETRTQAMKLVADDGWGVYVSDEFFSIHAELRCF